MKNIVIKTNKGDVTFIVPELDFMNVACDLEEYGVNILGDMEGKTLSICRALIAIITGEKDKYAAGKMLSEHIKNGGSLENILSVFREAMESAGFGQATEETATEDAKEIVQTPIQVEETPTQTKKSK